MSLREGPPKDSLVFENDDNEIEILFNLILAKNKDLIFLARIRTQKSAQITLSLLHVMLKNTSILALSR